MRKMKNNNDRIFLIAIEMNKNMINNKDKKD